MSINERKVRERAEREGRIVAAAAAIAEEHGWDAVTIRRLADEIEYSQPVLYSHFANRDAIVAAVAVEGFRGIAATLREAAGTDPEGALERVAWAYLAFAGERPATYQAMFVLPTGLRFADEDTVPELRDAFAALAAVVAPLSTDVRIATEVFWGGLHGMAELERTGRIPGVTRQQRLALFCMSITGTAPN
jgi:AcrR family transcriptional regulator